MFGFLDDLIELPFKAAGAVIDTALDVVVPGHEEKRRQQEARRQQWLAEQEELRRQARRQVDYEEALRQEREFRRW